MIRTILLVDDDTDFVELLGRRLEAAGYAVVMACDGREGLIKAQASSPDLVLLDLQMPVMDGFDALRELKSSPKTATIPVIVLSGQGERKNLFRAEQLGADDFVVKPFAWEALLAAVRAQLGEAPRA
jgi:DNA-binding response OmpR family regulator